MFCNFRMARNRHRNRLLWVALGYFMPISSPLILKFLKSKVVFFTPAKMEGSSKTSYGTHTDQNSSRGIVVPSFVDKVLNSWIFDEVPSHCPSCRERLATKPKRKTTCPFCGKAIYVRTNNMGYTELLNESDFRFYKK